ncbi:MAG: hypothetical protein JNM27_11360 [Leptospirales bacterium]|nr:hypothetical protein [Leptospirales bacterium]
MQQTADAPAFRKRDQVRDESRIAVEIDAMKVSYGEKISLFRARTNRNGKHNAIKMAFSRALKRTKDSTGKLF